MRVTTKGAWICKNPICSRKPNFTVECNGWSIYEIVHNFLKHFFTMKEGDKGINLSSIVIPKARRVFPKSLFLVSTPKEMEDINVSLPCVGWSFHYHFFAFVLVIGMAWKTTLTQQWICLFMENPMVCKLHRLRS